MFVILEIDSFSWQAEIIWFGIKLASTLEDALLACALLVLPLIVGSRKLSSLVALQLHNAHPTIKNCGDCKMPTLDFALEIAPIACTNKKKATAGAALRWSRVHLGGSAVHLVKS